MNVSRDIPPPTDNPRRMVLLAPDIAVLPPTFNPVTMSCGEHEALLHGMQRLRGRVYLDDGALQPWQLTSDGRHVSPVDHDAWHILVIDEQRNVLGCARYVAHGCPVDLGQLGVMRSALAMDSEWGGRLKSAVEEDADAACGGGMGYSEVGGWALAKEIRGSPEALRIALATYALSRLLGGSVGLATATFRNSSAEILQRIGGEILGARQEACPRYYDPQYRCDMAIIRFDSNSPNSRYMNKIERLEDYLAGVPVVCNAEAPSHAVVKPEEIPDLFQRGHFLTAGETRL